MNTSNSVTRAALVDRYLHQVTTKIHAPLQERRRIENDLRSHLQAALEAGEEPEVVIARMGSPSEVAAGFMSQMNLVYATFWQRMLAFVTDAFVIAGVWVLYFLAAVIMPDDPFRYGNIVGAIWVLLIVAGTLMTIGLMLLYFPLQEGRFGQTLGKRVMKLRVLKEDGLPIGYKEAFLRALSFYFEIWPVDVLFIPFTEKRQRAFDIVARTVVVRELS